MFGILKVPGPHRDSQVISKMTKFFHGTGVTFGTPHLMMAGLGKRKA